MPAVYRADGTTAAPVVPPTESTLACLGGSSEECQWRSMRWVGTENGPDVLWGGGIALNLTGTYSESLDFHDRSSRCGTALFGSAAAVGACSTGRFVQLCLVDRVFGLRANSSAPLSPMSWPMPKTHPAQALHTDPTGGVTPHCSCLFPTLNTLLVARSDAVFAYDPDEGHVSGSSPWGQPRDVSEIERREVGGPADPVVGRRLLLVRLGRGRMTPGCGPAVRELHPLQGALPLAGDKGWPVAHAPGAGGRLRCAGRLAGCWRRCAGPRPASRPMSSDAVGAAPAEDAGRPMRAGEPSAARSPRCVRRGGHPGRAGAHARFLASGGPPSWRQHGLGQPRVMRIWREHLVLRPDRPGRYSVGAVSGGAEAPPLRALGPPAPWWPPLRCSPAFRRWARLGQGVGPGLQELRHKSNCTD